jgi:inosine-uridine nucleoside N-ribohydrolase
MACESQTMGANMMNRKHFLTRSAGLALILATSCVLAEPIKLIFDTDMGNDVDDLMALNIIHALQRRGTVELLAVTVTKDHPQAAAFVDAVNTFYGYPDIPIGVVKGGVTPEPGKFNLLADAKNEDGTLRYPHDLLSGNDAPEAVGLLRKTLAAQPDKSVTLVQVGFFTNFKRLLDSKPDDHSPLNGRDLIEKKVKLFALMAGAFQTVEWRTQHLEYNVVKDIPAAQALAKTWPTPRIWCGFEIGVAAPFPHQAIVNDLNYVKHHPLKEAYILYQPPPHDRPTWDPATLLYAVYPDRGYFSLSPHGTVTVEENGATVYTPSKGPDRFLLASPEQAARIKEAITQLSIVPPTK